ncbi:uncharacterized protein [Primulina huaijiensis]|uniref:uncharacterized protein n=1 Tax=Primulina huaijiensis TaxID=1492673 RepID=UPI003CC797CD
MDALASSAAFRPPVLDGSDYAFWKVNMRIPQISTQRKSMPSISVGDNMFSLITNCTYAKDAWDILQKYCEGSKSVRRTKLRMLASKFESLGMKENETIVEYDRRLRDIANKAFSLGDPLSSERLVNKELRSLPERFNFKICAIDESKDTFTLNLED